MTGQSLPRGAYTATPCRACRTPKPARWYLCGGCWAALPAPARRALNRRDGHALARLRELHAHIDSEQPLNELEITL
ncbi:hypothetical protein RVR_4422 [Actinacidiphila reveromycinica]|uniref:Uncharacterized protein n=1 Tax=Actinacidiphila reveromycinica TaxID=659352 RepID=A0A7U3VP40_9ACTN|nr:hypothetical protein [Streptomyces sp. SN-593]BBA98289.1 hypothetical protein RVR_4422 [Streptomyces sp. SN-593]